MRSLLKLVFIITLLELFVGGGGRVFEVGGITLRILLFAMNICIAATLFIYKGSIPRQVLILMGVGFVVLIFYGALGWFNGAEFLLIFEDIKPLSYFFSILFFYLINNLF